MATTPLPHFPVYTPRVIPTSALRRALTNPTPEALWELRGDLLERGVAADAPVLAIVRGFRSFLDRFATTTSSRDLNHLASKLDIGAIGGVFLEQLLERSETENLAMRLLTGGISEGLMALASRQYVRAQEGELAALIRDAAWELADELWRWTAEANPDLDDTERRQLIDGLLAPLNDPAIASGVKAGVAGRLFQILLVAHLDEV